MTFTPSPWRVSSTGAIMAAGGQVIAMPVDLPLNDQLAETQSANARLIAAAPSLYEALEKLSAEFRKFSRYGSPIAMEANDAMQCADSALANARGEA